MAYHCRKSDCLTVMDSRGGGGGRKARGRRMNQKVEKYPPKVREEREH